MIKRSSSRNHRSKGIKVKRSHDKKKEFDESDAKVSVGTQTAYQIPKLGRKDLHPGKDQVNQDEKHEEEEEDENIIEEEDKHEHNEHGEEGNGHEAEEKEDDKHGVRGGGEEQEEDENKSEEMEDERGGGDDEIDENDQEKSEVDADHDEEFMDEEKEKEEDDEKENENSEDEEKEGSVEKHNSHEAREEQYKGDDASSAVTHDTHTTSTETETVSLQNSDVSSDISITKSENKPNYTEDGNRNPPSSDFKITEVKLTDGISSDATSGKETGNSTLSNPLDSSHLNNGTITYFDSHAEASSNLTEVIHGASNNMTGTNTSSEPSKMEIFSKSNQLQNDTINTTVNGDVKNVQTEGLEQGGNRVSEENLPGSNLTVTVKTENGAAAGGEIEKAITFVASNETENKGNTEMSGTNKTQNNTDMKENTDTIKDEEFKGDTQANETVDSSSANGTSDSVEHHATDSHVLKDVTEVRTDLDTLPDIRNEGDNGDATATD
ncbi:Cysteine-rich receptor-like protein kinase 25 [Sesbania bispinosa]|nr:Cysteine-rich receptor-like protein kinase 25 [Sesbania bispinosa]